ncbi:hypothetical protein [Catenulispora pinisilvae]|uniref:hypothetical protein n=1 Tax=Catenulispora pinisilvae TaxID=2705253 RepID=UPI0018926167|nr:hypothetical protein [Catenulispora pinisilvae]
MTSSTLTAVVAKVVNLMAGGMSETDAIAKAKKEVPGGQNHTSDAISDALPEDPSAPKPLPINGAGNGGTVIAEANEAQDY